MSDDLIQIVDKDDRPIGEAPKKEAWRKGLIHRITRIMIYDKTGRVLLQRRSKQADIWPDCWTYSASGHVDVGETYEEAAQREVAEELDLSDLKLQEVSHGYTEPIWGKYKLKRFTKDYRGILDETPRNLQRNEVSMVRWFTVAELRKAIKESPDNFTPSIKEGKWLSYK